MPLTPKQRDAAEARRRNTEHRKLRRASDKRPTEVGARSVVIQTATGESNPLARGRLLIRVAMTPRAVRDEFAAWCQATGAAALNLEAPRDDAGEIVRPRNPVQPTKLDYPEMEWHQIDALLVRICELTAPDRPSWAKDVRAAMSGGAPRFTSKLARDKEREGRRCRTTNPASGLLDAPSAGAPAGALGAPMLTQTADHITDRKRERKLLARERERYVRWQRVSEMREIERIRAERIGREYAERERGMETLRAADRAAYWCLWCEEEARAPSYVI